MNRGSFANNHQRRTPVRTIMFWVYPVIIIAAWLVVAAFTLSGLATVGPSLRSIAATQHPGSRPTEAAEPNPNPGVAHAGRRPASGG